MQSYLIDLINSNRDKKDGPAQAASFGRMIDRVEAIYKCLVVAFCCDNDGGSQSGRKILGNERFWLFIIACCAHQVISILNVAASHVDILHVTF